MKNYFSLDLNQTILNLPKMAPNINDIMLYAESLIGLPFRWYVKRELETFSGNNAFWCENSLPPSSEENPTSVVYKLTYEYENTGLNCCSSCNSNS